MTSRSLPNARAAFERGSAEASRDAHSSKEIVEGGHLNGDNSIGQGLYHGALEGLSTSALLLITAYTASVPPAACLRLGAGACAGLALLRGLQGWLRAGAQARMYAREREREAWELTHFPEGEGREMVELWEAWGVPRAAAETAISALLPSADFFVDLMMAQELKMQPVRCGGRALVGAGSARPPFSLLTLFALPPPPPPLPPRTPPPTHPSPAGCATVGLRGRWRPGLCCLLRPAAAHGAPPGSQRGSGLGGGPGAPRPAARAVRGPGAGAAGGSARLGAARAVQLQGAPHHAPHFIPHSGGSSGGWACNWARGGGSEWQWALSGEGGAGLRVCQGGFAREPALPRGSARRGVFLWVSQ